VQPGTTLTDTLQDVVRILVDAAHPTRIILFGSHARGEQTEDSDLDLVVVLPEVTDRVGEMVKLRRALTPIRMPIDILVYSEADVAARAQYVGTALYDGLQEGRVVYATR
jgi:uncharacterized protein